MRVAININVKYIHKPCTYKLCICKEYVKYLSKCI